MRSQPSRLTAFTLVELLVVIAVISVLISLIMPALGKVREQTYQIKCAAVMRGFISTSLVYDIDYKAFPNGNSTGEPYQINSKNFTTTAGTGTHITLRDSYGLAPNATLCPSASLLSNNGNAINFPASWKADGYFASTSYYYFAGNGGWADTNLTINGWARNSFDINAAGFYPATSSIKPYKLYLGPKLIPSQQFFMFDYNGSSAGVNRPDRANHAAPPGAYKVSGQNVSFIDGHVEWQVIKSKVSWEVYTSLYWTPTFAAPAIVTAGYYLP